MRKPIIAGNWKMNKIVFEAEELVKGLVNNLEGIDSREIVVAPPFTALCNVYNIIKDSNIKLGAQNMYFEDKGAYTGEVSPIMLKDVGCSYVILGHSERRAYFGETNEIVNKKIKKALEHSLIPIVCVGEKLEEREAGKAYDVVKDHVEGAFKDIDDKQAAGMVIAYEPVWAIGTGKTAKPEDAQDMHSFIRKLLSQIYSDDVAQSIRILYGGSVKPENVDGLMAMPDIDGALVGGASLKIDSFTRIVMYEV